MLAEYVRQNDLKLTQEDIFQAIYKQASQYPGQEKEVFEYFKNNKQAMDSITGPQLEEKAVEHIFANKVSLTEKTYTKDKFEKMLEKEMNSTDSPDSNATKV
jgi:trigger factor